jgi:hypothetical protein
VIKIGQGRQARNRRTSPWREGHRTDLRDSEDPSREGRGLSGPSSRHLLDRGPRPEDPRIAGGHQASRSSSKVGATNYIPYIASGIARMGAAGIIIDGAGAGTGAAPSVVKNNVGIPIELATASVDAILRKEGLRETLHGHLGGEGKHPGGLAQAHGPWR